MNIYDEPVSFQTQVRVAQVYAMMHQCRLLQHAYQYSQNPPDRMVMGGVEGISQRQRIWLTEKPYIEVVQTFQHAALANHFVCANWATCDELPKDDPEYLTRDDLRPKPRTPYSALRSGAMFVPNTPDFKWLRRFIHSVVIWDVSTHAAGDYPIREVALGARNWGHIADLLERELDNAVRPDYDPWSKVRR